LKPSKPSKADKPAANGEANGSKEAAAAAALPVSPKGAPAAATKKGKAAAAAAAAAKAAGAPMTPGGDDGTPIAPKLPPPSNEGRTYYISNPNYRKGISVGQPEVIEVSYETWYEATKIAYKDIEDDIPPASPPKEEENPFVNEDLSKLKGSREQYHGNDWESVSHASFDGRHAPRGRVISETWFCPQPPTPLGEKPPSDVKAGSQHYGIIPVPSMPPPMAVYLPATSIVPAKEMMKAPNKLDVPEKAVDALAWLQTQLAARRYCGLRTPEDVTTYIRKMGTLTAITTTAAKDIFLAKKVRPSLSLASLSLASLSRLSLSRLSLLSLCLLSLLLTRLS
jgi:hypothetical protein